MRLPALRTLALTLFAVLALEGCATNLIEGLKTNASWLLSRTNDRPEDLDRHPDRNDASLYSEYQTERALMLSSDAPAAKRETASSPVQLRRRVLKLAPLGSDIGAAKICLELNGFACAWLAPTHRAMGCNVHGVADPLRVHISARNHAVTEVAVSALPAQSRSN